MQVCETFLNKKWQTDIMSCDTVSVSTEQKMHIELPRGLGLGGKDLAWPCQGQDLHEVSSRILKAKARHRGQQDCCFSPRISIEW